MYPHCLLAMLGPLMAEPAAGLAASGHTAWAGGPCPMLLTPAQCYEREFVGAGLFMLGPAGMLLRTDAFRRVGGFDEVGPHSDLAFWLKACRTASVLLVPSDLYWYRVHSGQEAATVAAETSVVDASRFTWEALHHPGCPLDGETLRQARRHTAYVNARRLYRLARVGRFSAAAAHARGCGMTAGDWLRYLRRPHRVDSAGTPMPRTFSPERWGRDR
jgi:hypothetical protein